MIEALVIEDFRSLRRLSLSSISHFFAIAGRNGRGKSNVLRAVNLFFNNEVEPGVSVNLSRDFNDTRRRKKKRIRVEVTFRLPQEFTFRKQMRAQCDALGLTKGRFRLARVWEFDEALRQVDRFELHDGKNWQRLGPSDRQVIDILLTRLITFRYVPNHVHPQQLIEDERRALQDALVKRLRSTGKATTERTFKQISDRANKLIAPVADVLRVGTERIAGVKIATPTDWADVALSLGIQIEDADGSARAVALHGSGHQSLLAYALLHLIDTQFSASFGWRQATIWGIEEPESFLHPELAHRVARAFRTYAHGGRFQLIATTHSPCMLAFADSGAVLDGAQSSPPSQSGSSLLSDCRTSGSISFLHPLLENEARPLLLVEGVSDVVHISAAYSEFKRVNPWEIRPVEEFGVPGGDSGLDQLLQRNTEAIRARSKRSPLVLLYDDDYSPAKLAKRNDTLSSLHSTSRALRWDPKQRNAKLDPQAFRGIESYLTLEALELAERAGALTLARARGVITRVLSGGFDKTQVADVCSKATTSPIYRHFGALLDQLDKVART